LITVTATNSFLRQFGFVEDPFASTNAGNESGLADYFVPPPYFHAVLGDPSVPQSHVVFAPRGGGKTAQRRMVENFSSSEGSFLCVTYNQFELPAGFSVGKADLAYNLTQIARTMLLGILLELDESAAKAESLTAQQRQLLKYLIDKLLGDLSAGQFERALAGIKSRGDKVRDWLVAVAEKAFELGTQDESLRYQFAQLADIARSIGFTATYILVDGIDELDLTGSDASATYSFIRGLVNDLQTLESPGVALKFFMWDQIEDLYREGGARPDRVPQFTLRWSVDQLQEMLRRRLSAFSEGRVESLGVLICADVPVNLDLLVAQLASGSPRDMVRMAQRIVAEATRETAEVRCIDEAAVWSGVRSFSREPAEELFGRVYLDRLTKVGEVTFTISRLASDVFRISENAARSGVQKWLATGQVAKIGEVPSKGRPQNVYGVMDVRLALAISPSKDITTLLTRIAFACPMCGHTCISDRAEIDCSNCGASFEPGDARSLMDVVRR
jgi:hypothetical protein